MAIIMPLTPHLMASFIFFLGQIFMGNISSMSELFHVFSNLLNLQTRNY